MARQTSPKIAKIQKCRRVGQLCRTISPKTRTKFKNRRRAFFSKGIAVLNAIKVIFEGWNFVVGLLGPKLPKSTFFGGYVWGAMSPSSLGLLPNLNTSVDYTALSYWKLYKYSSQPLTPLQQTLWHFWLTNWQKLFNFGGPYLPKGGENQKCARLEF